ncbi:hypothetical protein SeMB42_g05051 [Synchytrium endobioticum]|nr:hypothetical protein SeMB42_g05051 [Synchytrium endobioticum]
MHGPLVHKGHTRNASSVDHKNDRDWVLLDSYSDLDAKDPRWAELFIEFFLQQAPDGNDDLLFFVKAYHIPDPTPSITHASSSSHNIANSQNTGDNDLIFVRRKVSSQMPTLHDVVDWKQTFFLNTIVQLPCTLTVAVCKRGPPKDASNSNMNTSTSSLIAPLAGSGVTGSSEELSQEIADAVSSPVNTIVNPNSNSNLGSASTGSKSKSRMIALRRVKKKVYAAPYRSRMDVKDAFMNECSYPLVYYTVNDYESHDLHLPIHEREYLCVELSVAIPKSTSSDNSSVPSPSETPDSIDADDIPFPTPLGHDKIVLFQGAVPYSSLLEIFLQKGLAAQNMWNRNPHSLYSNSHGMPMKGNGSLPKGDAPDGGNGRTEYIMMRGPHGKGQCQVAITEEPSISPPSPDVTNNGQSGSTNSLAAQQSQPHTTDWSDKKPLTLADRLRSFGSVVRQQVIAATASASSGSGTSIMAVDKLKKPDGLRCSMTYVNVPWQSIIGDLNEYAKVQSRKPGTC